MHRSNAPASDGSGSWSAAVLDVDKPARPGLRMEVSGRGRLLLRQQVRDGILPPILLWWISGLDCYVILDGHDRLAAALAEEHEPPLLALSSVSAQQVTDETHAAIARYTATVEHLERQMAAGTPGSGEALAATNRHLAEALRLIETAHGTTRAWPLAGGTAAWRSVARAHAPAWLAEVDDNGDGDDAAH